MRSHFCLKFAAPEDFFQHECRAPGDGTGLARSATVATSEWFQPPLRIVIYINQLQWNLYFYNIEKECYMYAVQSLLSVLSGWS